MKKLCSFVVKPQSPFQQSAWTAGLHQATLLFLRYDARDFQEKEFVHAFVKNLTTITHLPIDAVVSKIPLEKISWSISMIKHPWMEEAVYVQ